MAAEARKLLTSSLFSIVKLLDRTPAVCSTAHPILHSRSVHSSGILHGGRPKSFWRTKRNPANTRINHELPEKIKERKAFGGHKKLKALRINKGCFTWTSLGVDLETPIISVVHSYSNKDHVEKNIVVKGSIVQIDANPFRTWHETQNEENNMGRCEPSKESEDNLKLLNEDVLYAKISTRPGQVGVCNGYVLEGQDLEAVRNILNIKTTSSESRID